MNRTMSKQIEAIKKAKTIEDLEELGYGSVTYDISHRGGNLGFSGSAVAEEIGISEMLLPRKFGAYCNYLGGGLRGSICISTFSTRIRNVDTILLLEEIGNACKRVYEIIENQSGLNDDEYKDGSTNWEAIGTKSMRDGGVESAY